MNNMEKDKKSQQQNGKNNQMSLEFSNPPIPPSRVTEPENSRIILLSEYKFSGKANIDYSNLVLKNTKSF